MPIQFDGETGKFSYQGKEIGEHMIENGRNIVRINLEYEGGADDWMYPIIGLADGLSTLAKHRRPPVLLTIETPEDSIDKQFNVPRQLNEKLVKRGGYVWNFHKADADPWPSPLHGHDYDKHLKLDATTGDIYDAGTRKRCMTLK